MVQGMTTTRIETKITVHINDIDWMGERMTINSTRLGYEDHGIFTFLLDLTGPGHGQGFGGYGLDNWIKEEERRVGTAFGMDCISSIISTVGVDNWEDLKGKDLIALRKTYSGMIEGIISLDGSRYFIVDELVKRHFPDKS